LKQFILQNYTFDFFQYKYQFVIFVAELVEMIIGQSENSFFTRYIHESFKITSVRPAYLRGLRVAVLLGLPVLIGLYTNKLPEAFLFMFATLNVTLVDMGGMTYRKTARIMLITTFINAIAAIVAQWAGLHILTACVITAFWIAAVAMLGLLGNSGIMMAFVNSAIFVIIVANPDSHATTSNTFVVFIAGGIWAMALSLLAWPVRPYQPIRKAIAECFIENAAFLKHVGSLYQDKLSSIQTSSQQITIDIVHLCFREKIDQAYDMLSSERKGRFNKSEVEDMMISLLHSVSKDHRLIITLLNEVNKNEENTELSETVIAEGFFIKLADIQLDIAKFITNTKISEQNILDKVESLKKEYLNKEKRNASIQLNKIYNSIEQLLDHSINEIILASRQHPSFKNEKSFVQHESLPGDDKFTFFKLLRTNLTLHSTSFRHAMRIGIISAIAVFVAHIINLPHSYWIPLTVIVIMAPDFGGSFLVRTLQRGIGTILGGIFAVLLISEINSPLLIAIFLIILTFIAISMLTVNYAVFVFFLTPLIVTMYSISDLGDWHIPLARVLDTLTGMALTLIGGQLLFPDWERNHLHDRLSSMIDATNSYFNAVFNAINNKDASSTNLISLNRKMELAASNTNASLQKTLTQPGFNNELIQPLMSFMSASKMLMRSVIRLHEYSDSENYQQVDENEDFIHAGQLISELLSDMSDKTLLTKSNEDLSTDRIVGMLTKMNKLSDQIKVILSSLTENSLATNEIKQVAEIEDTMLNALSSYISKYSRIKLPVFLPNP